ncbi:MAG: type II toxin-antitoxin system HigB family toxin [Sulfuricellaceae bacterium]
MKLVSNKSLREFAGKYPDADEPLRAFRQKVEKGTFGNFVELRAAFAGVDKVGERYVFNIGGNKHRLIAGIHFVAERLFVKAILTHAEYDKGAWK